MNLTLNMTDRELRAAIHGKPRESAKLVGSGFDRHWEYRGVRIASRRQSGWNAGSVWWSDPINGTSVTSRFKDVLLTLIDAALDGMEATK
jgi:hypothetical protein